MIADTLNTPAIIASPATATVSAAAAAAADDADADAQTATMLARMANNNDANAQMLARIKALWANNKDANAQKAAKLAIFEADLEARKIQGAFDTQAMIADAADDPDDDDIQEFNNLSGFLNQQE